MRLWPRSLVGRNLLLLVALILVGQLVAGVVFRRFVQAPFVDRLALRIADSLSAIESGLAALPTAARPQFVASFNAASVDSAAPQTGPSLVLPAERLLIARISRHLAERGIDVIWRREAGGVLYVRLSVAGESYWLYTPGVEASLQLPRAALVSWTAGLLLALLGAYLLQRRINRPLAQLVEAAQAVGHRRDHPPLPETGPEEIVDVCRSFNRMREELADQDRQRELMLAGVSHDLRTPLTKVRLATEMLADDADPAYVDSIVRGCNQIDTVIGQFSDFAGVGSREQAVSCDLNALIRGRIAALDAPFELQLGELPPVRVRRHAFGRLIDNLVENARRYAAPPFSIVTDQTGGFARVQIADRGPGIAADQVADLMRPFRRGDHARGGPIGTGLGLAIAARIIELERGRLRLQAHPEGGLVVVIELPLPGTATAE